MKAKTKKRKHSIFLWLFKILFECWEWKRVRKMKWTFFPMSVLVFLFVWSWMIYKKKKMCKHYAFLTILPNFPIPKRKREQLLLYQPKTNTSQMTNFIGKKHVVQKFKNDINPLKPLGRGEKTPDFSTLPPKKT